MFTIPIYADLNIIFENSLTQFTDIKLASIDYESICTCISQIFNSVRQEIVYI